MKGKRYISDLTEESCQQLLSLASVFEESFSIDWLIEVAERKPSEVLSVLEEGVREGILIRKKSSFFSFSSPVLRRKWQDYLSQEERSHFLEKVANYLVLNLEDREGKAKLLAPYLLQSGSDIQNCCWLMTAGDEYTKSACKTESLKCYKKVTDDLGSKTSSEADFLFSEAVVKYSKVSSAIPVSVLKEGIERAKRRQMYSSLSILEMQLAKYKWLQSKYLSALKWFEKGWARANKLNDPNLMRSATTFSTFFLYWQGRFREAIGTYEASVADVDKYPEGRFPLLAELMIGHCYALTGQITQGLGMINSIHTYCSEKKDRHLAGYAGITMGAVLLDIQRISDATQHLESCVSEAIKTQNEWVYTIGNLLLAFSYYKDGSVGRCTDKVQEFVKHSKEARIMVRPYPYLIKLCWAIKEGILPKISDLSLEHEIDKTMKAKNIFMKGVACRYKALLEERQGADKKRIIRSLMSSVKFLEQSGNQFELARTYLHLAQQHMALQKKKAKVMEEKAKEIMLSAKKAYLPDDLKSLVKDRKTENLDNGIFELVQDLVTVRNDSEFLKHIVSEGNRALGAERGAVFVLNRDKDSERFQLKSSKNLTDSEIGHPSFHSSWKVIGEVADRRSGRIIGVNYSEASSHGSGRSILSRICAPIMMRDKVIGVLYHDNRLLSHAFSESDLNILSFFAALAAVALNNLAAHREIEQLTKLKLVRPEYLGQESVQIPSYDEIIGKSGAIIAVLSRIELVAGGDTTVLITGETGTGKELVARAIHKRSRRNDKPFVTVDCSALDFNLISSELFGHEKGAFTGAVQRRIGRFELANQGTLFLDEIGELPLNVQARLLRVLQTREFERLGGNQVLTTDCRLVAATNRNLEESVAKKTFREDLYYRMKVFPIHIPPLRERTGDIPLLVHHFLRVYRTKNPGMSFGKIPPREMQKLQKYHWPGNVRELENVVQRAVISNGCSRFSLPELHTENQMIPGKKTLTSLSENERQHILRALEETGWKVRGLGGSAGLLEIHPSTLEYKMKKLNIKRPPHIPVKRSAKTY
ncbi:MAG: sigma 54-interacting transcriptional regulator [Deltaproteobacteria bacterium]|nr:sigma 54-interacting transcriptional regulator [Deltaproteobacteria bacterium]MBW2342952.1 sigma 54-interacting transcriptional regulator [Deltaproteobacteria bacterium]